MTARTAQKWLRIIAIGEPRKAEGSAGAPPSHVPPSRLGQRIRLSPFQSYDLVDDEEPLLVPLTADVVWGKVKPACATASDISDSTVSLTTSQGVAELALVTGAGRHAV